MLKLEESLEALQTTVLHAVWAADIEKKFNSFPANSISGKNLLDKGIVHFCQHGFLLSLARLFDNNPKATSLKQFLELAAEHAEQSAWTTAEEVRASVRIHINWITSKGEIVEQLKSFRDKQIAHLDKSSVRDFFDGKIAGITNVLGPDIVEMSALMLEEIIGIVDIYTQYFRGEPFDLGDWRNQIKEDCKEYIRYRWRQNGVADG